MLRQEANWFGQILAGMDPARVYPMCNVGSSTKSHRSEVQPWIDELIFRPAQAKGRVVHLDIKEASGVNLVGDLSDHRFLEQLRCMHFRSIFCSNLVEHVEHPGVLCQTLTALLPEGGLIFASCPHRYPYHPDPIDTMLRPGVTELANMFPGTAIIESQIIDGGRYLSYRREPYRTAMLIARGLVPFYRPINWLRNGAYLPWFARRTSAACVILQKVSKSAIEGIHAAKIPSLALE